MPNWCENTLFIRRKEKSVEEFKALKTAMENETLLNHVIPAPDFEGDEWYSWRVDNWGTKWEIRDIDIAFSDEDEISCFFLTAWSPPIPIYEALKNQGFDIVATYREEGMCFMGAFTNEKGDQCISY